jgi:hypothetical protein
MAAQFIFSFGTFVEIMQWNKVDFLGSTYDPLDILMYGLGIGLGFTFDLTILNRLEK